MTPRKSLSVLSWAVIIKSLFLLVLCVMVYKQSLISQQIDDRIRTVMECHIAQTQYLKELKGKIRQDLIENIHKSQQEQTEAILEAIHRLNKPVPSPAKIPTVMPCE